MPNNTVKGLKPFIIKYMAMLMGICYLINPLQEPINVLLHEISHGIESPTHLIAHGSISNFEHKSFDHYDASSYDLQHDHAIVDLINTIFETSDEKNNSDKSLLKKVKIDKHITTNQFQLQKHFKINIVSTFQMLQEKSRCGYFEKMKIPPQHLIG